MAGHQRQKGDSGSKKATTGKKMPCNKDTNSDKPEKTGIKFEEKDKDGMIPVKSS